MCAVGVEMAAAAKVLKWSMLMDSGCVCDVIPAFWSTAKRSGKFRRNWTIV
jgi:hypothetical protein